MIKTCLTTLCVGGLALSTLLGHLDVNLTPSAPVGLYWYTPLVAEVPLQVGQWVLMTPPRWVQADLQRVGVVSERPWMKRVRAREGDTVCLDGAQVWINGCLSATRPLLERYPLQAVSGCTTLQAGEYFLLGEHQRSYDSRYINAIDRAHIHGILTPLWIWR